MDDFGLPFGSLWLPLGSLLAPFGTLWLPLGSLGAVFGPPKHLIASGLKWYILFGSLWLPLGFLLAPSGSLLGSIPSQDLLQKTASIPSLAAFRHRTQVVHPVKTLRRLKWYILSKRLGNGSEISLRSCRDSAENVPRTLQEPAENPPYEPQAKLPFTVRLLRKDAVRRQTLRQNRLE